MVVAVQPWRQWIAVYAAVGLDCDQPILEALDSYFYWTWVDSVVELYQANPEPDCFPWAQYQNPDVALALVHIEATELEYVDPSKMGDRYAEICIAAVRGIYSSVAHVRPDYVPERYHEICLLAIRHNPRNLRCLQRQTPELCLEAIRLNPQTLEFVHDQTVEMCVIALTADPATLALVRNTAVLQFFTAAAVVAQQ